MMRAPVRRGGGGSRNGILVTYARVDRISKDIEDNGNQISHCQTQESEIRKTEKARMLLDEIKGIDMNARFLIRIYLENERFSYTDKEINTDVNVWCSKKLSSKEGFWVRFHC